MNAFLSVLRRVISIDTVIYVAIVLVTLIAVLRCLLPLSSVTRRLRRASRVVITETKQNKDKKSWRDLGFLGPRLESVWADFLQNAEARERHGETCDVSLYVTEDAVFSAAGGESLAELTPGLLTSLGILGTFLGLVRGLYGLSLNAADTAALLAAMEQLISGMSTAFLTSIAGVSASLLFTLLNNRQQTNARRVVDRFCEVFSLYAMPRPVSGETEMLSLTQEQTAYLRQAAEEITSRLAEQLENSVMRAMLPVQRSMDNFIVAATRAQVEGVDRIVQLFLQRMSAALGGEIDNLRQSLATAGAGQRAASDEIQAATAAIHEMSRDVINMQQMAQGLLEHFQAYVADMGQNAALAAEQTRSVSAAQERMAAEERTLSELISRMATLQAKYEQNDRDGAELTRQTLTELGRQSAALGREAAKAADGLEAAGKTLSQSAERQEKLARKREESTGREEDRLTAAMTALDRSVQALGEATKAIERAAAALKAADAPEAGA